MQQRKSGYFMSRL